MCSPPFACKYEITVVADPLLGERVEEGQVYGLGMKRGAERQHDAGRPGGKVHREPEELLARECQLPPIGECVPVEPSYLVRHHGVAASKIVGGLAAIVLNGLWLGNTGPACR